MTTVNLVRKPYIWPVLAMVVFFTCQNAMSATVYQWTDKEGLVHFSDVAPTPDETADADVDVKEIKFVDYAQNETGSDEYSIINQLDRMTERRRKVIEERLAKEQLQVEAQRLANQNDNYQLYDNPANQVYYPQTYYYPAPAYLGGFRGGYGRSFQDHHFGSGRNHNGRSTGTIKSKIDMF